MRKLRIAEWILALSMTHERAEAVAGDLSEIGRGALWFWRSVVATMIASSWGDFRAAWWKMVFTSVALNAIWLVAECGSIAPILPRSVQLYMRLNIALNWLQGVIVPFLIACVFPGRELATLFAGVFTSIGGTLAFVWWMWPNVSRHYDFAPWSLAVGVAGIVGARLLRRSSRRPRSPGVTNA